jgi:asparagine synthase (glutamine-hydrolysing)
MVADVPLGAFLSGGIDSTIIVGLMQQAASHPVKTFAIGFPDPAYDETRYAALAARHLGTEHQTFMVEPRAWETLDSLAWQFDEPFADSSALPTWHVARETRQAVTVALTGDAGDELFGGYDRYRALALTQLFQRLPATPRRWIGGTMTRVLPRSARSRTHLRSMERIFEHINESAAERYLGWMTTFDEAGRLAIYSDVQLDLLAATAVLQPDQAATDPASLLRQAWAKASRRDAVTQAMVGDLLTYLPGDLLAKVDMASMAQSLECRGPFLDHRVVELAAAMPLDRKLRLRPGRSKVVLKRAFADVLPKSIRTRRKMGFGVPVGRWFQNELKEELREILLDRSALGRGLFLPDSVRNLVAEHVEGRREHGHRLWALVMLELWFRNHIDGSSKRPEPKS